MSSEQLFNDIAHNFSANSFHKLNIPNENLIFSPISILSTLVLLLWGAKGTTRDEIASVLNLPKDFSNADIDNFCNYTNVFKSTTSESEETLKISDRIFVKKDEEIKNSPNFYGKSSINQLDFTDRNQAANIINNWVNQSTGGLIPDIVKDGDINPDTVMQVLNAVYFKGEWEKGFDEKKTIERSFTNANGENVQAKMLRSNEDHLYKQIEQNGMKLQVVELPYRNSSLAMLVVLPYVNTNIEAVLSNLNHLQYKILNDKPQLINVNLIWPKFTIENTIDLKGPLMQMGLKDVFSSANFSSMLITNLPLKISDAKHVAVIEVDEKGTKAAAVTKFEIISYSLEESVDFICDHPFIFYIVDKNSRIPFFAGTIKNLPNRENKITTTVMPTTDKIGETTTIQ